MKVTQVLKLQRNDPINSFEAALKSAYAPMVAKMLKRPLTIDAVCTYSSDAPFVDEDKAANWLEFQLARLLERNGIGGQWKITAHIESVTRRPYALTLPGGRPLPPGCVYTKG